MKPDQIELLKSHGIDENSTVFEEIQNLITVHKLKFEDALNTMLQRLNNPKSESIDKDQLSNILEHLKKISGQMF